MTKIILAAVIAFSVGYFTKVYLGGFAGKAPAEKCIQLDGAKSDLMKISQGEYLEYTKIKDLKQKYEKADELLGKIMLLFLADVGFRAQTIPAASLQTAAATVSNPAETATVAALPSASVSTFAPSEPLQTSTGLKGKAAIINSLRSEAQIQQALNSAIIENPKIESAKGDYPSQKQIAILEGVYTGQVKYLDGKRDPLTVTWELRNDGGKSVPYGSFRLALHGPSKNSETNGTGGVDNIKTLVDDPNGLVVNACGDECYLQLYYNAPSDQFYGNYYESVKNSKSKFERVGIIGLRK